jgi:hypothetical protein
MRDKKISAEKLTQAINGIKAKYQFSRDRYASGILHGCSMVLNELRRLADEEGKKRPKHDSSPNDPV